jgi:hypothetical protein
MKNINEMTLDELAKYAVTLDAWEWMPGMMVPYGAELRVPDWDLINVPIEAERWMPSKLDNPDFEDPATTGCVMGMVRAKYGPNTWTVYTPRGWQVMTAEQTVTVNEFAELVGGDIHVTGQIVFRPRAIIMASEEMPTEIHALIAALAKEKV